MTDIQTDTQRLLDELRTHIAERERDGVFGMKSPPRQIHDDIAFNRVEAFIRGEDNETLVGTEKPVSAKKRTLAKGHLTAAKAAEPAGVA